MSTSTETVMERQLERQLMRQRGAGSRQLIDAKPVFTFGPPTLPPTASSRTPKPARRQSSARKPRTATRSKPKQSKFEQPGGLGTAIAGFCLQRAAGACATSSPAQSCMVIPTIPAKRKRGRPALKRTDESTTAVEAGNEVEDNHDAYRPLGKRRKGKPITGSGSASKASMRTPLPEVLEADELQMGVRQDAVLAVIKRRGRPRKPPLADQQPVFKSEDDVPAPVDTTEGISNPSENLVKPTDSVKHGNGTEEKKTCSAGLQIIDPTTSDPIQQPVKRKRGRPRKVAMTALDASSNGAPPSGAIIEGTVAPVSTQSPSKLDNAVLQQSSREARKADLRENDTLAKKRGQPRKRVVQSLDGAVPPHAEAPATEDGDEPSRDNLSLAIPDETRPKKRGRPRKIVVQVLEDCIRVDPRPSATGHSEEVSGDKFLPPTKGSRPPEANRKMRGRPRKELVRVLSDPTDLHATTTARKASDETSDDTLFLAMHLNDTEAHRPAPKIKQNRTLTNLPKKSNTTTQDSRMETASSGNAPPQARVPLSDRTNTTPLPSKSDFRSQDLSQNKPCHLTKQPEQHTVAKVKPGPTGLTISEQRGAIGGARKRKRTGPPDIVPKAKRRCMVRPPSSPYYSSEADELALRHPPPRPAALV